MFMIYLLYHYILAVQERLKITAKSQNELLVIWLNSKPVRYIVFKLCWNKVGETSKCYSQRSLHDSLNKTLHGLKPATKYEVTVEKRLLGWRYPLEKRQKIAMTRSGLCYMYIILHMFLFTSKVRLIIDLAKLWDLIRNITAVQ